MLAGNPPFEKANINDPYYRLIKDKNYALFWKAHSRKRPSGFFNDNFKDLFVRMVAFNPAERPKIEEIASHPWVKNVVKTQAEVKAEFQKRLDILEKVKETRRQEEEERRKGINKAQGQGVRGGTLVDEVLLEIYESEQNKERELPEMCRQTPDDLILDENYVFVISRLTQLLREGLVIKADEERESSPDTFTLTELRDESTKIVARLEHTFEVEGESFKECLQVELSFGFTENGEIIVSPTLQDGDKFYFKKLIKHIRGQFDFCSK